MKAAFIYYSLDGNMDYIAKEVAKNQDVKLYRLSPKKDYPTGKFSKYFWCGKSATFGERPKLNNPNIKLDQFDTIIIGSPVWAGTLTPPINTFLHDYNISSKNIILIATHASDSAGKCFDKMKKLLNGNDIIKTFDFVNPLKMQDSSTTNMIVEIRELIG